MTGSVQAKSDTVRCSVNGEWREVEVRADEAAVDVLRDRLGLTGAKLVCGEGVCGACTVLLDGVPVTSCLLPATALEGRALTTVEGFGPDLHPVQRAFIAHDALQCGYCTPGFVVEAIAFHDRWRREHGTDEPAREEIAQALAGHLLHARALLGCGAQGVVGDGRELEEGGVVVWAASLPGAEIETFHLETVPTSETAVAVAGMPELDGADAVIVLVDPYTFPIDPVLAQLADDQPGLPVVGGLASAGGGPRMAVLMHDDEVARRGAVGVALSSVDVRVCVSQGARPIGPEMAITAAEGNVIHELPIGGG